jgi:hypothetical protein
MLNQINKKILIETKGSSPGNPSPGPFIGPIALQISKQLGNGSFFFLIRSSRGFAAGLVLAEGSQGVCDFL